MGRPGSKKAKLKVKGIPIDVSKKVYWSKYGATVKTSQGVFSIRLPANMDCKAMEEWYRMNKARNFTEFYNALRMTSLPMFNIVYADRYDTIFYISNAKLPRRNPDTRYNWRSTLAGNTSATLWTSFKAVTELPQYVNPGSGYLFNTNHSPFLATEEPYNQDAAKADAKDGFELNTNNRSVHVTELMMGVNKMSYEKLKEIKFDRQYPEKLQFGYGIDSMLSINAQDYPSLERVITSLQKWNRVSDIASTGAAVFLFTYDFLSRKLSGTPPRLLTKHESLETYQYIHDHMIANFGTDTVTLGDVQKLVRGNEVRPGQGYQII